MLNLKKMLTKLCEKVTTKSVTITASHRSGYINFRKIGDLVVCWSPNDFTSLVSQEYVVLATIPTGYRPVTNMTVSVQNNRDRSIAILFSPTGELRAFNYSSAITRSDNGAFFAVWTTV